MSLCPIARSSNSEILLCSRYIPVQLVLCFVKSEVRNCIFSNTLSSIANLLLNVLYAVTLSQHVCYVTSLRVAVPFTVPCDVADTQVR